MSNNTQENRSEATTPLEKLLNEFQSQMQRIEALEERVEQRVHQARRRLLALVNHPSVPAIRQTHLRVFISHSHAPEITNSGAMAALMKGHDTKPSPPIWRLHIEGKLLVDHLDYQAADRFDKAMQFKKASSADDNKNSNKLADDEEAAVDAKIRPPVKTSQLFHKITVGFQAIFEPLKPAAAKSPAKKKKSSRRMSKTVQNSPIVEEHEQRMPSTTKQVISYKCCDQPGADIWSFQYIEPPSADPTKWKLGYIVASVDLYRRFQYPTTANTTNKRYRIKSLALQKALFPNHGPITTDALTGQKRNIREANTSETIIATHNQIHIPTCLTMEEITNAFFTYIRDKKLTNENDDPSVVVADKLLQDLLGMEHFPFSQLQQLLFTRYLIEPITYDDPIRITYIMEIPTASVLGDPNSVGDVLQFDTDIFVPSLFPVRVRELMRRVKRREMEYTAARAKARYLIPHGRDDRRLKEAMDSIVQNDEINADVTPVHLAIVMGAPEGTEPRDVSACDAQLSYLMGQLQDRVPEAAKAREHYEVWNDKLRDLTKTISS